GSTLLLGLDYGYNTTGQANNNGNLLSHTIRVQGSASITQSYTYDGVNRLQSASENGGTSWSEQFGYDRYGNMWVTSYGGMTLSAQTATAASWYDVTTN